ncbi:MAG: PEP/pyruvate-binding domain-containing protein [Deltaproteobacteria bacterium]|nr:PEP/pyruvate-binding domain-containing protein [Deltaproteobacteria bacterium]
MGLRDALTNPALLALDGKLVKLTASASSWTIAEVTPEEAQAWWDAHAPPSVTLPSADLSVTTLADVQDVTPDPTGTETLRGNLARAITIYGGKAAHYSVLVKTPGVPIRPAFVVPIYFYDKWMRDNGFYDRVTAMLADPTFVADPATRDAQLAQLRADMLVAPMDASLVAQLEAKVAGGFAQYPKLKFRSSSNSEDLEGFPCAGCYDSFAGKTSDTNDMLTAIRRVWASAWEFRTFELRAYYKVPHDAVGVAVLCHQMFQNEDANGIAITANPFDASGLDPAYYVNVQFGGDVEVVAPPAGTTSDQFLYYFSQPNQPISFIAHSNLIPAGTTVLTAAQTYELGQALEKIHARFSPAYGPAAGNTGWYALEVDIKFTNEDDPSKVPHLYIKQARWYPDRNGGQ